MPEPYYQDDAVAIYNGDCREVMPTLEPFDLLLTDPPYGLKFIEDWDHGVPGVEFWTAALRVAKPGAHLLAFGGTRTFHRLACAIEDAGWEIRDTVMWVYGCLSDDTELLIDGRWEPYYKAIDRGRALCYNPDHETFSWEPIQEFVEYEYDDTAFRIRGDCTDQIVSRNHRCLVERSGGYVFAPAETLEREESVPVLESVQDLLDSLPVPDESTSDAESVLRGVVQANADTKKEAAFRAQGSCYCLPSVRQESVETERLAAEGQDAVLFAGMQRQGAREGTSEARAQGAGSMDGGKSNVLSNQDDWGEKSGMEGRRYLFPQEEQLQDNQIRPMPRGVSTDGETRRVCDGAPAACCACVGALPGAPRGCASPESRPSRQSAEQFGTVCQQSGAQVARASRFTRSDLARVEPFHYKGKIWCIRVPSGAFVARRNGKVFVTGNSGFPKSHDVSKAIDREAGAERKRVLVPTKSGNSERRGEGKQGSTYGDAHGGFRNEAAAATDAARQWEGWGSALKPAHESIIWAGKPLTVVPRNDIIRAESNIGGLICLSLSHVKHAESLLRSSPNESGTAAASARLIAAVRHGLSSGEPSGATAMFKSPEMARTVLSIAESWSSISAAICKRQNMFTTSMVTGLTTALRIFNCLISEAMRETITPEGNRILGQFMSAPIVDDHLNDASALPAKSTTVQGLVLWLRESSIANIAGARFMPAVKAGSSALLNAITSLGENIRPAHESIIIARKPFKGTIAANVLEHGTGALNIDGCRAQGLSEKELNSVPQRQHVESTINVGGAKPGHEQAKFSPKGRWPANLIHDGSDEVVRLFPGSTSGARKKGNHKQYDASSYKFGGLYSEDVPAQSGSAARFFYCAKASKKERGEGNNHPTVKPVKLMQYLIRLGLPPGGVLLDPFAGSGTTGVAAKAMGCRAVLVELEERYCEIAANRMREAVPSLPLEKNSQEERP